MKDIAALVLAAGKGTRMKSDTPKVLHELLGRPMIDYVLDLLKAAGINDIVVVIGHGGELLKETLNGKGVKVVVQKELLGSGDAVSSAREALESQYENVVVLCGDAPLIKEKTLSDLLNKHKEKKVSATILSARVKDPTGYGRIVRDNGRIVKIVEEEVARLFEEVINEVNSGTYCFKVKDLYESLAEVGKDNAKGEFYLTDIFGILSHKKKIIESVIVEGEEEIIGINSRVELAEATRVLKSRIMEKLMLDGVTIQDPATTVVYPDAKIGRDTIIYPDTVIESDVEIGSSCHIGPFARIRSGVRLEDKVEVGNFVELVRTKVGKNTRVKHHTYLGDTVVGKDVNIGAGVITANYDGKKKHKTAIGDGAFIGVGARLVAPVKIGKGALVGAGAVVLKDHDVPDNAVCVGVPARLIDRQ